RASFSRNLAAQALPLAMCLAPPPALRDFHPVEFAHAERTSKRLDTTALLSKLLDFIKILKVMIGQIRSEFCQKCFA
ncbi:hypothetical protein, partial [Parasutterella excrementihominis]|uniref:hypothetical protein n=1 Tax=Parasutterella excrementihominis TaxID=487175 RepID=UPI003AAE0B59